MGALFRIKLIQSLLAVSAFALGLFFLIEPLSNVNGNLEMSFFIEISPYISIMLISVLYFFIRSTFIIPLAFIANLLYIGFLNQAVELLILSWTGIMLIFMAYPVFYFKYLDFKHMLSMLRLIVPLGIAVAGYQLYISQAQSDAGIFILSGLIFMLVGNVMLLFNFKKWVASGIAFAGLALVGFQLYSIGLHHLGFLLAQILILWIILHHDTATYEPKAWDFASNVYFRLLVIAFLITPALYAKIDDLGVYLLALR